MAKIYSQLEKAQLENTTADVGSLPKGMITYRTDLNISKVSNGTSMIALIDESSTQTLSAKTLTTPLIDDAGVFEQISTPANPAAGYTKLYPKTDNRFYALTPAGVETKLADVNVHENLMGLFENLGIQCTVAANALTIALKQMDGATDPTSASPTKVNFRSATATSGANSTLTITSGRSITVPSTATLGLTAGSNVYIYVYLFNDAGTPVLAVSSRDLYNGFNRSAIAITTGADDGGTYSEAGMTITDKPNVLLAKLRYDTAPNGTYSVVPQHVILNIDNAAKFRVENGSYTPTLSWVTGIATNSANYSVAADGYMTIVGTITINAAVTAATLTVSLPAGYALDTTVMSNSTNNFSIPGGATFVDNGGSTYPTMGLRGNGDTTNFRMWVPSPSGATVITANVSNTSPFTWANGDSIFWHARVPVIQT